MLDTGSAAGDAAGTEDGLSRGGTSEPVILEDSTLRSETWDISIIERASLSSQQVGRVRISFIGGCHSLC